MRKSLLVLTCLSLLLAGSSVCRADDNSPGAVNAVGFIPAPTLGVEAGINLANLNGQNVNDVIASRLGFVGGAYLNLPFTPTLRLQPEVMYEQKGGKINGNPIQLGYLEVPVLLDIKLIGPLGIIAGPSFELNTDSNGIQNVNSADVGLVAGAQVNLSRILLSGRYEVGLSDVSSSQKVQNGLFTFLVGLSLL
jgi:hypothetical protein